jgi:hypothetical protein
VLTGDAQYLRNLKLGQRTNGTVHAIGVVRHRGISSVSRDTYTLFSASVSRAFTSFNDGAQAC